MGPPWDTAGPVSDHQAARALCCRSFRRTVGGSHQAGDLGAGKPLPFDKCRGDRFYLKPAHIKDRAHPQIEPFKKCRGLIGTATYAARDLHRAHVTSKRSIIAEMRSALYCSKRSFASVSSI